MPGRYSHGLVLAQYSSQGIISLPNDDYHGNSARTRDASAVTGRQRTTSYGAMSLGYQSMAAQSVQHAGGTSSPRTYNLTPSSTQTTQKRLVVVQSESEEEPDSDESEGKRVRTQPRLSHRSTPSAHARIPSGPRVSGTLQPTSRSALGLDSKQATEQLIHVSSSTQRTPTKPKMPEERRGGVKALIQARHQKEMEKAGTNATSEWGQGKTGLSLREMLQNPAKPGRPIEKLLTIQEFLQQMPVPGADTNCDGSPARQVTKIAASTQTLHVAHSDHRVKPNSRDHPPAYSRQHKRSPEKTHQAKSIQYYPHETEPNFGTLTDDEENARFPFPVTSTPAPASAFLSKAICRVQDEKPDNVAPKMTCSSSNFLTDVDEGREAVNTPRLQHPVTRKTKPPREHLLRVESESSLSSLDSQGSGIFGVSSISGTTRATSRYPTTTRTLSTSAYQRDWDLPPVRQCEHDSNLDNIVRSMDSLIAHSTSEEQVNGKEHDLSAPRLPSIPEKELSMMGQWGTISAGQKHPAKAREADEMSAVFPPDIGRHKHEVEERTPSPLSLAVYSDEVEQPQMSLSINGKPKNTEEKTGFLRKLKKKAMR